MAKLAWSCVPVIPEPSTAAQLKLPEPSVSKTCPAVPSDVGKVNAFDIVTLLFWFNFKAGVVLDALPT